MNININDHLPQHKYIRLFNNEEEYNQAIENRELEECNYSVVNKDNLVERLEYQPSTRTTNNDNLKLMNYFSQDDVRLWAGLKIIWGYFGWEEKDFELNGETLKGGQFYKVKPMTVVKTVPDLYQYQHLNNFLLNVDTVTEYEDQDFSTIKSASYLINYRSTYTNRECIIPRSYTNMDNLIVPGLLYYFYGNFDIYTIRFESDIINLNNISNINVWIFPMEYIDRIVSLPKISIDKVTFFNVFCWKYESYNARKLSSNNLEINKINAFLNLNSISISSYFFYYYENIGTYSVVIKDDYLPFFKEDTLFNKFCTCWKYKNLYINISKQVKIQTLNETINAIVNLYFSSYDSEPFISSSLNIEHLDLLIINPKTNGNENRFEKVAIESNDITIKDLNFTNSAFRIDIKANDVNIENLNLINIINIFILNNNSVSGTKIINTIIKNLNINFNSSYLNDNKTKLIFNNNNFLQIDDSNNIKILNCNNYNIEFNNCILNNENDLKIIKEDNSDNNTVNIKYSKKYIKPKEFLIYNNVINFNISYNNIDNDIIDTFNQIINNLNVEFYDNKSLVNLNFLICPTYEININGTISQFSENNIQIDNNEYKFVLYVATNDTDYSPLDDTILNYINVDSFIFRLSLNNINDRDIQSYLYLNKNIKCHNVDISSNTNCYLNVVIKTKPLSDKVTTNCDINVYKKLININDERELNQYTIFILNSIENIGNINLKIKNGDIDNNFIKLHKHSIHNELRLYILQYDDNANIDLSEFNIRPYYYVYNGVKYGTYSFNVKNENSKLKLKHFVGNINYKDIIPNNTNIVKYTCLGNLDNPYLNTIYNNNDSNPAKTNILTLNRKLYNIFTDIEKEQLLTCWKTINIRENETE